MPISKGFEFFHATYYSAILKSMSVCCSSKGLLRSILSSAYSKWKDIYESSVTCPALRLKVPPGIIFIT